MATLKRLVLHMAREDIPEGYAVSERGVVVPLWKETTLRLDREYRGGTLSGAIYTLTNVSDAELVMEEQEFYRPGVLAVAIERTVLAPGTSSRIYVISEEGSHD